jgi:tetratricopeptide (TPR) repeat protein
MRNYGDFVAERVQNLTRKLFQKQREGNLLEELTLCVRLAQLHFQLSAFKDSVQFWQSCLQIAADLGRQVDEWRAVSEIAKIYCVLGQTDAAEALMNEQLKPTDSLQFTLFKVKVLLYMAEQYGKVSTRSVRAFLQFERALSELDAALEGFPDSRDDEKWTEGVLLRADLLVHLGSFEESRYSEAIEVYKAVLQSSGDSDVLLSLRCRAGLAKIYFNLRDYRAALSSAIAVIDEYKKSLPENSNYRPRRRIYCEMLCLTGKLLAIQQDFEFALENLLLAREEAQALTLECEVFEDIEVALKNVITAQTASSEIESLQRRQLHRPKDLEELAGKYELIGDYERAFELLEQCRAVSVKTVTQRRLDEKLLSLSFDKLENWQRSVDLLSSQLGDNKKSITRSLMKIRALEKLGRFGDAEASLLELKQQQQKTHEQQGLWIEAELYFHYRLRGCPAQAEKYRDEALSLETVLHFQSSDNASSAFTVLDPTFSYFATRKPSNSLMKMVGSGMVMRTKTRKTKGLDLKRQRGRLKQAVRHTHKKDKDHDREKENLADFIVSSSSSNEEQEEEDSTAVTKRAKKSIDPAVLVVISSSDDDESPKRFTRLRLSDSPASIPTFSVDSPLFVSSEKVSRPLEDEDSDTLDNFDFEAHSPPKASPVHNHRYFATKVIIRIKKGSDILIPIDDSTVIEKLIESAQSRYERLFASDFKQLGRIRGLSLNGAMLFEGDTIGSVVSIDSQVLKAHFEDTRESKLLAQLPAVSNAIDEDFHRKFQILNLKRANDEEVVSLKTFQDRFTAACGNGNVLNLSGLSLQSESFSEYSGLLNKFMRLRSSEITQFHLNLSDNFLVDEDLRYLSNCGCCVRVDLSKNFFKRPNWRLSFPNCTSLDLSYNPLDVKWFLSSSSSSLFSGLEEINLIGCFEQWSQEEVIDWGQLARRLARFRVIKLSCHLQGICEFLQVLCGESVAIEGVEELTLFGISFMSENNASVSSGSLNHLGYLNNLRILDLTACTFNGHMEAIDSLCTVLKRTLSLKRLVLSEMDLTRENWLYMRRNGIDLNFSLEQVEGNDEGGGV